MLITKNLDPFEMTSDSRVLFVMPHPDDESIFAGGLLHKLGARHIPTRVLTMSAGEKSTLVFGLRLGEKLADVRKKEVVSALAALGIHDSETFHFPDGDLEHHKKEIVALIEKEAKKYNATHVFTLEPDGVYGHPDHIALSSFTSHAVGKPKQIWYVTVRPGFAISDASRKMARKPLILPMKPDVKVVLSLPDKIAKIRALWAHATQFRGPLSRISHDARRMMANELFKHEYFARGN